MSDAVVELRNIKKRYDGADILNCVNFEILTGQTVGICGVSGSGKTTLTNIAGMLEPPTSGTVLWCGKDVTHERPENVTKQRPSIFGYIFQQSNMIPELNVIENVLFPKKIFSQVTSDDRKFAETLLGNVGLPGFSKKNVSTLSGGERQRVAVVRAVINRPKVVIADEPTGSLDEASGLTVMQMIIDVCEENGSSLLLITHNQMFAAMMEKRFTLVNGVLSETSQ